MYESTAAASHHASLSLQAASDEVFQITTLMLGRPDEYGDSVSITTRKSQVLSGGMHPSVACGAASTAVVTKGGKLFTAGQGINGQLGHALREDVLDLTAVQALGDIKVDAAQATRERALAQRARARATLARVRPKLAL